MIADISGFLKNSGFIRLEQFDDSDKNYVIHQLEQYNYDSVFILTEDFENKILNNERDNIIEAYYTDRSLFYVPAKEFLASLVQEYLGELAVYEEVYALHDELGSEQIISEDISSTIENTQEESNLLTQELSFQDTEVSREYDELLNPLDGVGILDDYAVRLYV